MADLQAGDKFEYRTSAGVILQVELVERSSSDPDWWMVRQRRGPGGWRSAGHRERDLRDFYAPVQEWSSDTAGGPWDV